jgi:hypothetical protein
MPASAVVVPARPADALLVPDAVRLDVRRLWLPSAEVDWLGRSAAVSARLAVLARDCREPADALPAVLVA